MNSLRLGVTITDLANAVSSTNKNFTKTNASVLVYTLIRCTEVGLLSV